jgi:hypothetical protein
MAASKDCQQIVPHTEVVDLKAQLQVMENLISSSQETIKVLLGVIQELEKGEAHREGYVCLLCLACFVGSSPKGPSIFPKSKSMRKLKPAFPRAAIV